MSTFTAQQIINVLNNRRLSSEFVNYAISKIVENTKADRVLHQLSSGRPSLRTGDIIKFKGGPE